MSHKIALHLSLRITNVKNKGNRCNTSFKLLIFTLTPYGSYIIIILVKVAQYNLIITAFQFVPLDFEHYIVTSLQITNINKKKLW